MELYLAVSDLQTSGEVLPRFRFESVNDGSDLILEETNRDISIDFLLGNYLPNGETAPLSPIPAAIAPFPLVHWAATDGAGSNGWIVRIGIIRLDNRVFKLPFFVQFELRQGAISLVADSNRRKALPIQEQLAH